MIHGDYGVSHKQGLVRDAQGKAGELLARLTPQQRDSFALRLAGLVAVMWPASDDKGCLSAIEGVAPQVTQ